MSLYVYDNVVDVSRFFSRVINLSYSCRRIDNQYNIMNPYWTHVFYDKRMPKTEQSNILFYEKILDLITLNCKEAPKKENLYSAYINVLKFGDTSSVHTDVHPECENNKTLILYLNSDWNHEWGGETLFFNSELDVYKAVQPRPGRIVIFDGRIPHTGRAPIYSHVGNRYVLTLKYMDKISYENASEKKPFSYKGINDFDPKIVDYILNG